MRERTHWKDSLPISLHAQLFCNNTDQGIEWPATSNGTASCMGMLYLADAESLRDWGQLGMTMRAFLLVQRPARQRVSRLLKLDYLTSALQEGCVYSLASPTESDVLQARDCTQEEATMLFEGSDKPPRFFEVLTARFDARSKYVRPASLRCAICPFLPAFRTWTCGCPPLIPPSQ